MPDYNIIVTAKFVKDNGYTLYVTSTKGGNAETKGNKKYSNVEKINLPEGKIMYKIENVPAGQEFDITSLSEKGYKFAGWEYRPRLEPIDSYIEDKSNDREAGFTKIIMPASDLTVTAIFKKDTAPKAGVSPQIRVSSNNINWGEAHAIINGQATLMNTTYKVEAYKEYIISFDAKPGYYFINWNYSTTESPFIEEDIIKMPNKDLEVIAMFAPIPPQGEGGHKIPCFA